MQDRLGIRTLPPPVAMRVAAPLLALLLAVDAALVGLHVAAGLTYERIPALLNIALDGSLGELWGYAKWLAAAGLLFGAWSRGRNPLLLAGAAIFLAILADDALGLHEAVGGWAEARGALPELAGVRPQDLGELLAFGALGVLAAALFGWAWLRRRPGDAREARWLPVLLVLLAAFGVALDAVHSSLDLPWPLPQILDILEDGGELALGSLVVAHALALRRAQARPS